MEIICLEEAAFYKLLDKVAEWVKLKHSIKDDKWVSGAEAMRRLNISSKTSLQNLRHTSQIRFTQPQKKVILYDTDSINAYLEKHAKTGINNG